MPISRRPFTAADGRAGEVVELRGEGGFRVLMSSIGATLMRIDAPDRTGRIANVVAGSDDAACYPTAGGPGGNSYMGASCGRVANRIAGARFVLDGVEHRLADNEGGATLHGGTDNFSMRSWDVESDGDDALFRLHSPAGDQGFPGAVDVAARVRLTGPAELEIAYEAVTDAPTHVNIVSHPYFNLSGRPSPVMDHWLWIDAERVVEIDVRALPTGRLASVADTPFDFRRTRRVGGASVPEGGYNHCFVLEGAGLRDVAALFDPGSGRRMTVATDRPGVQLYTGDHLDGLWGWAPRTALCLETEDFPDAANRPDFPSTRLDPGELYRSVTRWRFDTV